MLYALFSIIQWLLAQILFKIIMSDVKIARNYFQKFKHEELSIYKIDLLMAHTL